MFKKGGGNARRWGFLWALGFKPRLTSWPRPVVQLLSSVWQTPHIFLTFFKTLQGPSHIFQHCFKTFQDPPHIFQHCFKTPQDLSHILHFSTLFQGVALHASRLSISTYFSTLFRDTLRPSMVFSSPKPKIQHPGRKWFAISKYSK